MRKIEALWILIFVKNDSDKFFEWMQSGCYWSENECFLQVVQCTSKGYCFTVF